VLCGRRIKHPGRANWYRAELTAANLCAELIVHVNQNLSNLYIKDKQGTSAEEVKFLMHEQCALQGEICRKCYGKLEAVVRRQTQTSTAQNTSSITFRKSGKYALAVKMKFKQTDNKRIIEGKKGARRKTIIKTNVIDFYSAPSHSLFVLRREKYYYFAL